MPSAYTAKILRREARCQVSDCTNVLEKAFYKRYRVCPFHAGESTVVLNGVPMRFCKGHGRFHSLDAFDGDKKGCREMLDGVNARRKRKKQNDDSETSTEEDGGAGSSTDDEGAVRRSRRPRRHARRADSHSDDSETLPSTASKESMQTASGPTGLALPPALLNVGPGPFAHLARAQLPPLTVEDIISLHSEPLLPSLSGVLTADLTEIFVDFPVPALPHHVVHHRPNTQQHQRYQHQGLLGRSELAQAVSAAMPAMPAPVSAPLPGAALEVLAQLQAARNANANSNTAPPAAPR